MGALSNISPWNLAVGTATFIGTTAYNLGGTVISYIPAAMNTAVTGGVSYFTYQNFDKISETASGVFSTAQSVSSAANYTAHALNTTSSLVDEAVMLAKDCNIVPIAMGLGIVYLTALTAQRIFSAYNEYKGSARISEKMKEIETLNKTTQVVLDSVNKAGDTLKKLNELVEKQAEKLADN